MKGVLIISDHDGRDNINSLQYLMFFITIEHRLLNQSSPATFLQRSTSRHVVLFRLYTTFPTKPSFLFFKSKPMNIKTSRPINIWRPLTFLIHIKFPLFLINGGEELPVRDSWWRSRSREFLDHRLVFHFRTHCQILLLVLHTVSTVQIPAFYMNFGSLIIIIYFLFVFSSLRFWIMTNLT